MAQLILWGPTAGNGDHSPAIRNSATQNLAGWLRQHGYSVKVIDFCHLMSVDDLVKISKLYITDETVAIGVSSTFWGVQSLGDEEPPWIYEARQIIEQSAPKIKWLMGGAKTYLANEAQWIRFFGEGEDQLLRWMDSQTSAFKKRDPFKIINQQKQTTEDDFIQPHEFLTIELARGCQFKCRFCSYPGIGQKKGTYLRNFEHVKAEILYNYERWGTTSYYLTDDTVNEDQDKILQLANFAQTLPFKLQWIGYNRLDLVGSRAGAPQMLKDSGLISTFFGVESFNPIAAKAVGKPWNSKYGKSYLDTLAREWGDDVTIHCSLIVGLPGESPQSVIDDNEWFRNSGVKSWYHNALFLNRDGPVCEFDREAEKYGYSFTTQFIWKNEFYNLLSAKKLCARITHENRQQRHTKIAGWSVGEYASNNILTIDQAHQTSVYDIPEELIAARVNEHVQRYVEHQLNKAIPF